LSAEAVRCGFGEVADIRAVREGAGGSIAAYLTGSKGEDDPLRKMSRAAYLTARKHGLEAVADKTAKRVRPLRFSRGWPGGGLTAAERDFIAYLFRDQEGDGGPFEMWSEHAGELRRVLDERARMRRAMTAKKAA
jgi:hypothetical protein